MSKRYSLDPVAIDIESHRIVQKIFHENPLLDEILGQSRNAAEFNRRIRRWISDWLKNRPHARRFRRQQQISRVLLESLEWCEYAAIRILDYIDHAGREFPDQQERGRYVTSDPFRMLYHAAVDGAGGGMPPFFTDMLMLFRQLNGTLRRDLPTRELVEEWMARHPSGLDPRVVELREQNRERIIEQLVIRMDAGKCRSRRYVLKPNMSRSARISQVREWWEEARFHLSMAARRPKTLNELLDNSLSPETLKNLANARSKKMPLFVNPYYLSLLHTRLPAFATGSDLPIRDYVFYTHDLVKEFGRIVAWELEDMVRSGEPNAAGWLLPSSHSVHRRYPDVAILIPDTTGRACGGLCAPCQRLYDFQRGNLNFDLDKLEDGETWPRKLERLMKYFEEDTQLRDILITGGDALMNSDRTLTRILNAVLRMATRKRENNKHLPDGEKFAEMQRVRLGTRLPAYLPFRVTPELVEILTAFRQKGLKAGISQFIIQTHFETAMEVTPEATLAVQRLLSAGWMVVNQQVFTASASRRGHAARLRQALNDIGVLTYYTFSVKGFMENRESFATNARAMQEQMEEKAVGVAPAAYKEQLLRVTDSAENSVSSIRALREAAGLPFLATDRNVLNLPGLGKSLTFRTIGITRDGRRILEFDHDLTRAHSPIVERLSKFPIVESKSIAEYLSQLAGMGEEPEEYKTIWGYSLGATEPRTPIFDYPPFGYKVTRRLTNIRLPRHLAQATKSRSGG